MKIKIYTILFAIILLAGGAFAVNELSNLNGIDLPATMIGGSTVQANFSFDYMDFSENEDNSPLIVKLNMLSSDDENFPVWRNDFTITGYAQRSYLFGLFIDTVYFDCSEEESILIENTIGDVIIENTENGTFYCYNEDGNLDLDRNYNVFLDITPHTAIWPGSYTLSSQLYYLNDTTDPVVLILEQSYFDQQYFRDGSYVDFLVNISDGSGIKNYNGLIEDVNQNISFSKENVKKDTYHFYQTLPIEITEGEHVVRVIAIDNYGHTSEDTAIIKIDLTSPSITLIDMENNIFSNIIPIKINVTDEKSGVDYNNVYYRIREIKEGFGLCPENGEGFGNATCYNSDWLNAPYNSITELNYDEFDSNNIPEGEYWLEIRAQDILLNSGVLE